MIKILVTGGLGFIGSEVIRELKKTFPDCFISCVDLKDELRLRTSKYTGLRYQTRAFETISMIDQMIYGPFRHLNHEYLEEIINDHSIVVHLGATVDTTLSDANDNCYENNYRETLAIVKAVKQTRKPIIFASSASIYGNGNGIPLNRYASSKLLCEKAIKNLPYHTILRFFNVYGSFEDHKGPMASVVNKLLKGQMSKIWSPESKRDFVHVSDVAVAVCSFVSKWYPITGSGYGSSNLKYDNGTFDVGTGEAVSFTDVLAATKKLIPVKIEFVDIPNEIKDQYQHFTCANNNNAFQNLGLKPKTIFEGVEIIKKDLSLKERLEGF